MPTPIESLESQVAFVFTAEFDSLLGRQKAVFLRDLVIRFRREFPGDPQLPMLELLVAGFNQKVREEEQELARLN